MRARCGRMAACGGGNRSNVHLVQELYATRRQAGFQRSVLRHLRGHWRLAPGRSATRAVRPDYASPSFWARTGGPAAIDPGWSRSPPEAVSGWKLCLVITYFPRYINSEIAVLCGWRGAATHADLLVGPGGTHEEIARQLEGGFVGRALRHAQRAALELLDSASGDRLVGSGVPSGAARAITRRRGRRSRAWGEARGPRTAQSRALTARTRGAA